MRIGVMQIIDTLEVGGAEKVAVDFANHMPRQKYVPYLCTTRRDGPLAQALLPDVKRLNLRRRYTFDPNALLRLRRFIGVHDIRLVHAHGSAVFLAAAALAMRPRTALIWHMHYGGLSSGDGRALAWRAALCRVNGVMAVNDGLAAWCRQRLGFDERRVWYVPNPVDLGSATFPAAELPGQRGLRVICVANFRREKDHRTLMAAMALVTKALPGAHLLLAGGPTDPECLAAARRQVSALGLDGKVSFLGQRTDAAAIMRACDIGVLSSITEGLPVSLLEYGAAGLAAVATAVGQCPEVLDHGKAGVLATPGSETELAEGIIELLRNPERRAGLAAEFQARVNKHHSPESVMRQICEIYGRVLSEISGPAASGETASRVEVGA
jgi:glycosyltransferase involved in cell wall biosynthesis